MAEEVKDCASPSARVSDNHCLYVPVGTATKEQLEEAIERSITTNKVACEYDINYIMRRNAKTGRLEPVCLAYVWISNSDFRTALLEGAQDEKKGAVLGPYKTTEAQKALMAASSGEVLDETSFNVMPLEVTTPKQASHNVLVVDNVPAYIGQSIILKVFSKFASDKVTKHQRRYGTAPVSYPFVDITTEARGRKYVITFDPKTTDSIFAFEMKRAFSLTTHFRGRSSVITLTTRYAKD